MRGRFGYIPKLERDMKERQKGVSHTIYIGTTGSGKNYTSYNHIENGIYNGWIKMWNLWITDWQHLQESLTFMFPSKEHRNKFARSKVKPIKFPVRIYVPISQKMPKWLPSGLCIPFTVSLDELTDDCIKLLCANKSMDYSGYLSEFRSMVRSGMTLPDLKKSMLQSVKGKILKEVGFDDTEWTQSHKAMYGIQQFLMRRMAVLDKEGIVANRSFPYALEKLIKNEIRDQNTIVILYLGAIDNEALRSFIYLYFFETVRKALIRYGGNKLSFKNVLFLNEIETLCKPTGGKEATPVDMVVNDYLKRIASVGRHLNLEIWGDCKSTEFVDKSILAIFKNEYFTRIDNRKEIRNLGDRADNFGERELHRFILQSRRRRAYRFVDLHSEMPRWFSGDFLQLGYELIRPRICLDGKVDMKYNSFTTMNSVPTYKVIGLDSDEKLDSKELKKSLRLLWKKADEKLEKFIVSESSAKEKKPKEDRDEKIIKVLSRATELKAHNDKLGRKTTKLQMMDFCGISNQAFYSYLNHAKSRVSVGDERFKEFEWLWGD